VVRLLRDSANAVPTTKNYAHDLPTFGAIAGVNPTVVQWKGLVLGDRLLDHGNPYALYIK
jgi:hypothetical protein